MAIIPCKYKNNDQCEYEGVPIAAVACQECLKDCEWQCTLYTGEDRAKLVQSLLDGLQGKDQPAEAIRRTMLLYRNCSDDENDYCRICSEAALVYLLRHHADALSEEETAEAEKVQKTLLQIE